MDANTSALLIRFREEFSKSGKTKYDFHYDEYERWPEFSKQALSDLIALGIISFHNDVYPFVSLNIEKFRQ